MSPSPSRHVSNGIDDIEAADSNDLGLKQTQTIGGMTISPELFEKLYLTPKTPHTSGSRFANPTPLGFVGFVISTFTFAVILMGWGGASGFSPVVGIFFFTGPVLLVLACIFEWIMGNFFSMMVMGLFAVFWLSFGMLQLPTLGLAASYSKSGTNAAEGLASPEYNAVVALYLLVWGFALFTYFIFTLKTNTVIAAIFFFVTIASWVLSGAYFKVASGHYATAAALQKAGGALLFIVAFLGWYMCFIIMAAEMRMPFNLPVGDLSHFWPATNVPLNDEEKQAKDA